MIDPRLDDLLDIVEPFRIKAQQTLDKSRQSEMGQYLTSPNIAAFMASMFDQMPEIVTIIDAGAGVGTLSTALVNRLLRDNHKPKKISIIAFEVDPVMVVGLKATYAECAKACAHQNVVFEYQIKQEDYIEVSVDIFKSRNSLFFSEKISCNVAIMNPPYRKINSNSRIRKLLSSIGIETTNLYTAFLWLIVRQLDLDGKLVAIVPRSFCNGTYFRNFRSEFLDEMTISRIHIFESRKKAFKEEKVLQENIILYAKKNKHKGDDVIISSSTGPENEDLTINKMKYSQLIHPVDPEKFIRIVPNQLGHQISNQMVNFHTSLHELGLAVSTGRVVDFRVKHLLLAEPEKGEIIPLIYPHNLINGYVNWPSAPSKKPVALASKSDVDSLVIPSGIYVLVKRFSSKEEKRRISAALFIPQRNNLQRIGIENHVNYFYSHYGAMSLNLARGLTIYLNSTLVDQYFRHFSGHTQVNATDLRNLKYPSLAQLVALGKRIGDIFPSQDEIDQIIDEEFALNATVEGSNMIDPIQAKRKIREALSILQMLNVPRAQQNDRSALTLLALLDVKANTPWTKSRQNLIGITEMMDYFRENYGVNYAPNTRETIRRQTVHQFMQLGLVVANPDDPTRPINSPKTRYMVDDETLSLIRSFGSPDWHGNLHQYIRTQSSLSVLQLREREMVMIPVILPDGTELRLSSGGQNQLIKRIIEEFCPRFTPGGNVIYIGDAGNKLSESEIEYFRQMGLIFDRHGKMPDVVVDYREKNWLVLIEAVTSHGPVDKKRLNELKELFKSSHQGLVFVTAFESRKAMHKFMSDIAWETEVWVAESPTHLIHFNGERFLGPY